MIQTSAVGVLRPDGLLDVTYFSLSGIPICTAKGYRTAEDADRAFREWVEQEEAKRVESTPVPGEDPTPG